MRRDKPDGLEILKIGDIVTIHFKEGFDRPNKQRFRYLGLIGDFEKTTIKDGYHVDGFAIVVESIDLDGKEIFEDGKLVSQALFPHTIKLIEVDDNYRSNYIAG